jgi:hypothetical protein
MNRWLKRSLTVVFLIFWLLIMLFPCMAFSLAMRTEIQVGSNVRIFLVSEEAGEGIGVAWQRPFTASDRDCVQTAVTYFMWTGEAENISYCQCTEPTTGAQLPSTPTCQ